MKNGVPIQLTTMAAIVAKVQRRKLSQQPGTFCNRKRYNISLVIRQIFFFFQNNPKNLDPSDKMDLDLWDCLGMVKLIL